MMSIVAVFDNVDARRGHHRDDFHRKFPQPSPKKICTKD